MGKSSPSPPPVPDPAATARAQGAANLEAAIASGILGNVAQTGPGGTVSFEETGGRQVGKEKSQLSRLSLVETEV